MSRRCPPVLWFLVMLTALLPGVCQAWWWNSEPGAEGALQVSAPFVEWRTGPGQGYPVFHVSERGEAITPLVQRTGWIKVRDQRGREGWVSQNELAAGTVFEGAPWVEPRPDRLAYQQRRTEVGLWAGDFEGATSLSAWSSWHMTANLSLELGVAQVLGSRSEIRLANLSVAHQPWPHWRLSPYFTLGGGYAWISPKATLAATEQRNNPTAHAGLGLRYYLTDRYFLRAEVRDYKVLTDRATNEEVTEWKIGLGLFF